MREFCFSGLLREVLAIRDVSSGSFVSVSTNHSVVDRRRVTSEESAPPENIGISNFFIKALQHVKDNLECVLFASKTLTYKTFHSILHL